jgi:hypothetical protein
MTMASIEGHSNSDLRAISPELGALDPRTRAFQGSRRSDFFQDLVVAGASVGVAHIDLIEFVMERVRIVHLAVKTA